MDKIERLFELHRILATRRTPIPLRDLTEHLQCSESTVRRLLRRLDNDRGAPVVYDQTARGWRYDTRGGERPHELPGLWFNASELYALLAAHQLLAALEPGLLAEEIAPLVHRIEGILEREPVGRAGLADRVRLQPIGTRSVPTPLFRVTAHALVTRRRLHLHYRPRSHDQDGKRTVSPQRLTWYRGNWYLDAWCHRADEMRRFALERIQQPRIADDAAVEIDAKTLEDWSGAYGIFAGPADKTAVLRFRPKRARWVADEQWHPNQEGRCLEDGRYELRLPYGDPRELVMDILKYGPDVEVVAPADLREAVRAQLAEAVDTYGETGAS